MEAFESSVSNQNPNGNENEFQSNDKKRFHAFPIWSSDA